jgi:hypothetical protein
MNVTLSNEEVRVLHKYLSECIDLICNGDMCGSDNEVDILSDICDKLK